MMFCKTQEQLQEEFEKINQHIKIFQPCEVLYLPGSTDWETIIHINRKITKIFMKHHRETIENFNKEKIMENINKNPIILRGIFDECNLKVPRHVHPQA